LILELFRQCSINVSTESIIKCKLSTKFVIQTSIGFLLFLARNTPIAE
jgi:hypothetical protein